MNKNKKYILIALLASLLFTVTIGFSVWIILSEQASSEYGYIVPKTEPGNHELSAQNTANIYAGEELNISSSLKDTYTINGTTKEFSIPHTAVVDWTTVSYSDAATPAVGTAGAATVQVLLQPNGWYNLFFRSKTVSVEVSVIPVAYYDANTTYYPMIDQALAAANTANSGTVYAIPCGDYNSIENPKNGRARIAKTITLSEIKSGVTLNISYAYDTTNGYAASECVHAYTDKNDASLTDGSYDTANESHAYNAHTKAETYCKNVVSVQNSEFYLRGTLVICGKYHAGVANQISGHTYSYYGELFIKEGTKIDVTGNVTSMGFISGSDAYDDLEFKDGSTLLMPFVFYDWRGGSTTLAMRGGYAEGDDFDNSPIIRFFFPNIVGKYRIEYGATANAHASVYMPTSNKEVEQDPQVVGKDSNAFIQLVSGTYLDLSYSNTPLVDSTFGRMQIDFHGGATTNTAIKLNSFTLTLNVKEMFGNLVGGMTGLDQLSVSSLNKFLPISCYLDVHVYGHLDTKAQNIRILPGGSVTVEEGAAVEGSEFMVLAGFTKYKNSVDWGPNVLTKYQSNPAPGALIIKGTLSATNFGGVAEAGDAGATLIVTGNVADEYELTKDTGNAQYSSKYSIIGMKEETVYYKMRTETLSLPACHGGTYITAGTYYSVKKGGEYLWYLPSFTVLLDPQGGSLPNGLGMTHSITVENPLTGYALSKFNTEVKPTRDHYTFSHWCTNATCVDDNCANRTASLYEEATLYAIWTELSYTVDFKYAIDGVVSDAYTFDSIDFSVAGDAISFPDLTGKIPTYTAAIDGETVTREYQFGGWWTTPSEGGVQIGADNININCAKNTTDGKATLYARWIKECYEVTIQMDMNSATPNPYGFVIPTTVYLIAGQDLTATSHHALFAKFDDDLTKQYCFSGWYYADGTECTSYDPEIGNTLTAKWREKDYRVDYNASVGSCTVPAHWVNAGESVTLPIPQSPSNGNKYQFLGWNTETAGGIEVGDACAIYTPTSDISLHAQWQLIAKVTYDVNGGTGAIAYEIYSGTALTLPTPTREGHTFTGWYTAATGGTKIGDADASCTPDADITLYAQWEKNSYTITVKTNGATVTGVTNGQSVSYGETVTVTVTYTYENDRAITFRTTKDYPVPTSGSYTFTMPADNVTINASSSEGCIAAGTLITLADGTQKKVEDVTMDDLLLVFNHETGRYEAAAITFIEDDGWDYYNVINLVFSDGTVTKLIYEHALFDLTLNKYVYITEQNYADFVGHAFAVQDGDTFGRVTLTEAFVEREYTGCYSLVTAYHLNYLIDGLFSIPGGIDGLFNIFEYGDDLKYDEEKMNADIHEFGLFTYEEFASYYPEIPVEVYEMFPAKYFKVSIGKGMLTFEDISSYIEQFLIKNGII